MSNVKIVYETDDAKVLKDGVIADNWTAIPKGHCRNCHQKINAYSKKYYQKDGASDYVILRERSARNSYCEECARKLSGKSLIMQLPQIANAFSSWKDGKLMDVRLYADGSVEEQYLFLEHKEG